MEIEIFVYDCFDHLEMLLYDHIFHREMYSMICQTGRPLSDWTKICDVTDLM